MSPRLAKALINGLLIGAAAIVISEDAMKALEERLG